jgi:hypothetical protein
LNRKQSQTVFARRLAGAVDRIGKCLPSQAAPGMIALLCNVPPAPGPLFAGRLAAPE